MVNFIVKLVIAVCLAFFTVIILFGCDSTSSTRELIVLEKCYDGVVYIEKSGQSNISVKFNPDSTVSTTLLSGMSCTKLN